MKRTVAEEVEYVRLNIATGNIKVECAVSHKKSPNIVTLYVELKAKHAELLAVGSDGEEDDSFVPCIILCASPHTLEHEGHLENAPTTIYFPEYKNWNVFAAQVCKYAVAVTLTKD